MPGVPAVELAVHVLDVLSDSPPLRLTDIVDGTGRNKSTVFNILRTLTDRGYLTFDSADKTYTIGPRFRAAALKSSGVLDYARLALPHMKHLVGEVGLTSLLGLLVPDDGVLVIEKVDSPKELRVTTDRGARLPAIRTALGKAILAFSPQSVVDAVVPASARETLEGDLGEIRRLGYACSRGEYYPSNYALAAPILNGSDPAVLAVSVLGFPQEFVALGGMDEVAPRVQRAAEDIAAEIHTAAEHEPTTEEAQAWRRR